MSYFNKRIFENSGNGMAILDDKGFIKSSNSAFISFVQNDLNDLTDTEFVNLISETDRIDFQKTLNTIFHGEIVQNFFTHLQLKNQKKILLIIYPTALLGDQDKITGVFLNCFEYPDQSLNRLNLFDRGDLYENLIKMIPDTIFIHSKGKFLFSNKSGLNLLGAKDFNELVKNPVIHYIHPDYKDLVIERIKNMESQNINAPPSIEKLVRLDGSVITVEVEGRPIKYGDLEANLMVIRDLTQILRDQEKLKESETRNKAILLALPDLMFILNKEGIILDFNGSDESELYLPKEIIIGTKLSSIFPENTVKLMLSKIEHTLYSKEKTIFEYQLPVPKGLQTYEARFIYYGENQVMALVRDITKEKEAEKDHLRMLRIDSIGMLAGGIAHDFNNILMKILGNINLMSLEVMDPSIIKYLNDVENATYQATKLTNQLLTFAKEVIL